MNDWLVGFSSHPPTDEELLRDSVDALRGSELGWEIECALDPSLRTTHVEKMAAKIETAARQGRELAHENAELDKIAFIPALIAGAARLAPLAGRAAGALGGAKGIIGGVAKDMAISGAANKVMGALKPAAPAAATAGEIAGGFKYAFAGGLLQRAAGYTVRHPGTALTAAGAIGGAMMAPRDPQTGQKQYLRGAVVGGMGAAGVNALSNGAVANKLRSSVMSRESPLLGQGTRKYLMDSAAVGSGKVPNAAGKGYLKGPTSAPAAATAASPSPATSEAVSQMPRAQPPEWQAAHQGVQEMQERSQLQQQMPRAAAAQPPPVPAAVRLGGSSPMGGYKGGPTFGMPKAAQARFVDLSPAEQILFVAMEKKSNQQTLTYDPATKTFTRQHLTPSSGGEAVRGTGAASIPAGHTEAVHSSPQYGSRAYFQSRLQKTLGTPPARMAAGTPSGAMRSLGGLASKMR
jgi:hypothetical protein